MRVLVIRLSAIGDVAMTIPVLYSVAKTNPDVSFTVLTQNFLLPLFLNSPGNIELLGIDIRDREKKLSGLLRFIFSLRKYNYDVVLDLHNVLRTKIIDMVFRLWKVPVFVLDKGRKERKQLTAQKNKQLTPLKPVIERYADVFRKAGFEYGNTFTSLFQHTQVDLSDVEPIVGSKTGTWIGIAPFAKHRGKIYPLELMERVLVLLTEKFTGQIFLLGAKGNEQELLEQWESNYPNVRCIAGKLLLDKELALISQLDLLVSMDSANMHFASLVDTPVISIWGATHPYAGFYGFRQSPENVIQLSLSCRPCSVFGNKQCQRNDWACMEQLSPERIVDKILELI